MRRERACGSWASACPAARRARCSGRASCPAATRAAYAEVEEVFTSIAAQVDGTPCCAYVGPDGAGPLREDGAQRHRVRRHPADRRGVRPAHATSPAWTRPAIAEDLRGVEHRRPRVVPDRDHGEGAGEDRREDRRPAGRRDRRPGRAEGHRRAGRPGRAGARRAADRHHRGGVRPRAVGAARRAEAASTTLAGPAPGQGADRDDLVDDIRPALYASKVVAYAQGFEQMRGRVARPTTGTSTSARWRRSGAAAASSARASSTASATPTPSTGDVENLLMVAVLPRRRRRTRRTPGGGWSSVATEQGVAVPAFSSSLAYYDGYRRERGPANLIQGLRDFFGAHTYRRDRRARATSTPAGARTAPRWRRAGSRAARRAARRRCRRAASVGERRPTRGRRRSS